MVDPTTANTSLAVPLRGSNVGTWDVPVNDNTTKIDSMFGGVTTLVLSGASTTSVNLASSQMQSSIIRLTGTLPSNFFVVFSGIYKSWTIDNQLTNSLSSFSAIAISSALNYQLGLAPGANDIFYDGTSIKYRNMQNIGDYRDYCGSGMPNWVTFSTVPPYLNCDGTAFSSATFPILATILGGTTLPDSLGRNRYTLNQGSGRLTLAGAGINGDSVTNFGGNNGITLTSSYIPTITSTGTVTTTSTNSFPLTLGAITHIRPTDTGAGSNFTPVSGNGWGTGSQMTGNVSVTYSNASPAVIKNAAPGYVGGITMIRSG